MPRNSLNTLYYGDNLPILREYIRDESVDLIYLDPPFNSNRNYNVLFRDVGSKISSPAQIEAFEDTWHWTESAQHAFDEAALHGTDNTARLLKAMVDALGRNDVTAYLSMMAVRLIELRRVLKLTGSLYLHCDPTASHYLKVLMDSVFSHLKFRSELIWKRTSAHSSAHRYGPVHDTLLFYSKSANYTWNVVMQQYDSSYVDTFFDQTDPDGRRWKRMDVTGAGIRRGETGKSWRGIDVTAKGRHWAYLPAVLEDFDTRGRLHWPERAGGMPRLKQYEDEMPGVPLQDVWTDVPPIHNLAAERLGYPAQKPLALLERIISASSKKGDVVLDPFCGCGTAVHAAEKLGRKWMGIDITHLAIGLIRRRMEDAFPYLNSKIKVVGEPVDLPGAEELARRDPYQFQWWAVDKVNAQPVAGERKKGMDRGVDGVIPFIEGSTARRRVIVSVKAGNLTPGFVRDLKGVLDREGEPIGVLVTLKEPTREMKTEALAAGKYHSERWNKDYGRIQIITAADLLNGANVDMPPQLADTFAQAPRERVQEGEQAGLKL